MNDPSLSVRVLITTEETESHGKWYIAQCLEHDVCVQARDMNDLPAQFTATFVADLLLLQEQGLNPLDAKNWLPAPSRYERQFGKNGASRMRAEFNFELPQELAPDKTARPARAALAYA